MKFNLGCTRSYLGLRKQMCQEMNPEQESKMWLHDFLLFCFSAFPKSWPKSWPKHCYLCQKNRKNSHQIRCWIDQPLKQSIDFAINERDHRFLNGLYGYWFLKFSIENIHSALEFALLKLQGSDGSQHDTHQVPSPPRTSTSRVPFNWAATSHVMEELSLEWVSSVVSVVNGFLIAQTHSFWEAEL